ncbi:MAG: molybdopterin-dependent oxidoreductase [bacterium]
MAVTTGKAPDFRIRQQQPLNAGPRLSRLGEALVTPVEHFFVRNHGDVPSPDPERHRLRVSGHVSRSLDLSLAELSRFPQREVVATLQCAGNRREEMMALRPIPNELDWGSEAVGNARWAGVALADVLAAAMPAESAVHVELIGLDEAERHGTRFAFGGSIPLAKALGSEVLLAVAMNGRPLEAVHGAPLRAVVPGYIGARSVKWLSEIRLRATPSENYFQARAYRLFAPDVRAENVVWEEGIMLGELPVNSIITAPPSGAELDSGRVRIEGLALVGGGRRIERVDVSANGGTEWRSAQLDAGAGPWAWRLWSCELDLPPGTHEIVARAWDSAAQTQPEHVAQVWNFKGYMNTAWPRVTIRCR